MLIDVHAHFYTERCPRQDWRRLNQRRRDVGRRIGITTHVASILGSWGARSPTYFPSRDDVEHANDAMLRIQREHPGEVLGYCVVNPNYREHAIGEIERRLEEGMVGIKLAASRRADDPLLDPVADLAGRRRVPILQHVWHDRGRDWPGQDASDGADVGRLASRHPRTRFILAHLGGGGDWRHSLRAVAQLPNVFVDLSGSGVDVEMLPDALDAVGPRRLLWGTDLTMDAAWGKLRYLESLGLSEETMENIRHRNARGIFPDGVFDGH